MKALARIRAGRLEPELGRHSAAYESPPTPAIVESEQLELLNREWDRLTEQSPYYGNIQRSLSLPVRFDSLQQFTTCVPETSKSTVQNSVEEMRCRSRRPDLTLMTGGSTASPVQIPAWKSERRRIALDLWAGRGWYGIGPDSRLFLLWGHSHLLGTGVSGWVKGRIRTAMDYLIGYHRFSAYDLKPEAMKEAAATLLRFAPDYFLGYSVALDRFARVNTDLSAEFRALGLKAVVGTAEAFPSLDSVARLESLFGCAVAMEYGAVETGVLSHTDPDGGYRTFWRTHFLEAVHVAENRYRLLVTSLQPRCFPLVRYDIGDEIEMDGDGRKHVISLSRFDRVVGRCNDYVPLTDGTLIHSELFTHAVRECSAISGYQIVYGQDGISLDFLSDSELAPGDREGILSRLSRVHPDLAKVQVRQVAELVTTVAGKTRMVLGKEG